MRNSTYFAHSIRVLIQLLKVVITASIYQQNHKPMDNSRKLFFIVVNDLYGYMPLRFKDKVKQGDFYRYIQDRRKEIGEPYTSIKTSQLKDEEFARFVEAFIRFTYSNVIGYYYDIENIQIISKNIEKKIKKLIGED